MTLAQPEETDQAGWEQNRRAFLRLIISVFAIDTAAVITYLILVFMFAWDATAMLLPLLLVTVLTGMYFQSGKQQIGR